MELRQCRLAMLALLWPALSGCAAGQPSMGLLTPELVRAYIPLRETSILDLVRRGAGVTIAPNIGVTNDHNLKLIPADRLLARSRDYDLLFFRTDEHVAPLIAMAHAGQSVIAYGMGVSEDLRETKGLVAEHDEYLPPRCQGCAEQPSLVFYADGGRGFSGGPVVDARTGAILGIVFGYQDFGGPNGGRRMYAYHSDLVIAEMHRLLDGTGGR